MASKLKLTELLYPTSTTPAITINADDTVTFGAPTTTITNLSTTSITDSGNLTFTGTGNRILGDFSNATLASRAFFQTSTTNGATGVGAITNGTGATSNFAAYGWSDPNNAQLTIMSTVGGAESRFTSTFVGTPPSGTYLPMTFYTGGSEAMRIDTSRNVGIGTSSPATKLHVVGGAIRLEESGTGNVGLTIKRAAGVVSDWFTYIPSGSSDLRWFNSGDKMTLDASGNFGVGTTSLAGKTTFESTGTQNTTTIINALVDYFPLAIHNKATSGNNLFALFGTEASLVARGSITYNRVGGLVVYNTTSDYRAKEIVGSLQNAINTVLSLKPYLGKMNGATIERPMFIAHEVQEVAPYAVTGEKDAVDKDDKPVYQQMDHSPLVPILVAAIQEQQALIQDLTTRLTALEGN
jgi:hypothetical protein